MSKQNGNGLCFILLIILFSEALLPFACLPFTLPFIIADLDPESRKTVLTWLAVFVITLVWLWRKSRSQSNRGDHR